jgi:hypothetical protein
MRRRKIRNFQEAVQKWHTYDVRKSEAWPKPRKRVKRRGR